MTRPARASSNARVAPDANPSPKEDPLTQPAPAPAPQDDPDELAPRRRSRRVATPPAQDDATDAALADSVARAAAADLPEPPIGQWLGYPTKLRNASDPLSLVRHLIVAQPNGRALVGLFASAACGLTMMVDQAAIAAPPDATLLLCGWCAEVAAGNQIPPYNRGQRRPILPDVTMNAVRARTPAPRPPTVAPEVQALLPDEAFMAAMTEIQTVTQRLLEGDWAPTPEETARISTLGANLKAAADLRTKRGPAPRPPVQALAPDDAFSAADSTPRRTRSEAASGPRGPRRRFATLPKQSGDGEAAELLDIRVGNSKATTLVRTRDPIGPYLLGYRSADGSHWIARDVRVANGQDPDRDFGPDKDAAIAWVATETSALSPEERTRWAAAARSRMKRNDPVNRRSR